MSKGPDPVEVLAELEQTLLGDRPRFTRREVAERSGVSLERAEQLWQALGFAGVDDEEQVFGEADVEALRRIDAVVHDGVIDQRVEGAATRALGQAMARLAQWQTSLLMPAEGLSPESAAEAMGGVERLVPVIDGLQSYVWRRHLVAAAARLLAVPDDDPDSDVLVVGFADLVGFTSLSRAISDYALKELVELFESGTAAVVAEHGGRVVKTIGDETMFVVRDPRSAADLALELLDWAAGEDDVPALRIGLACGPVVARLGDVYGPVVNIAARLTSVARPGRIVVDRELAGRLGEEQDLKIRRVRRRSVQGYARLEPWSLKRRKLTDALGSGS
jgi:adenylate cyclase